MAKQLDTDELRRVYNHVFLPPRLPQKADGNDGDTNIDRSLIRVTLSALEKLADISNNADNGIRDAISAIQSLKDLNNLPGAAVSEAHLYEVLLNLKNGRSAPVYVDAQNAAVVFTRKHDELLAEAFELSPLSAKVLATQGRLTRSFPGVAVSINALSHPCDAFVPVVAKTLATMCAEVVPGMQPVAYKAGESHDKIRDTTHPAAVTELFFGFLKGFGCPVKVSTISKNTRDEVLWSKAKLPWRRSPMWLLIKVVLQLVITRSPGGSTAVFKKVMVFLMSEILESAVEHKCTAEELHTMSAKIVRRLHKLRATIEPDEGSHGQLLTKVENVLQNAAATTSRHWQQVQQENSLRLDLSDLATLSIGQDTLVSLPALDEYISSVRSRPDTIPEKSFSPSSSLLKLGPTRLLVLSWAGDLAYHYATANLHQFEDWVAEDIPSWSASQKAHASSACHQLFELMQQYHKLAGDQYVDCPEDISVMILTIFELWVACDKLSVAEESLLADYDPDISLDVLQNLLLRYPAQMERLRKVEDYLTSRATQCCKQAGTKMFRIASEHNFAARYVDKSDTHQRVKSSIERQAKQARDNKTREYEQMEDIGKRKQLVTTGFSGTNDSRRLLPLDVHQVDLEKQKHTNALVLEHLLQPANDVKLMTADVAGAQGADADRLLSTILQLNPPVQVILDVGAQVLEYDKLGLAKEWLRLSTSSKEAVVFVNDKDELCVIDRKGRPDLLQTSPYASRLDACLIFLDESHTRGIDLKLPTDYRAAVTLGAHLKKDRLVQACMRMRKLGQGQSVVFCVSREIQAKIHENKKSYSIGNGITVADVLLWSISETHAETRRSMPLWAVQGERFVKQTHIWKDMHNRDGETSLSNERAKKLLEEDAQSLEERYRPGNLEGLSNRLASSIDADLKRIHARCVAFDGLTFNSGTLQEEQERELSPEIEQERQRPRAPPGTPAHHSLHRDVLDFAQSGTFALRTDAYTPAFESLINTSASKKITLGQLAGERKLFASTDFARVVKHSHNSLQADAFQRQVSLVLTRRSEGSNNVDCIMIISEFEANELLPRMESATMTLHKYKARVNSGYKPLDSLDLFTTSTTTITPEIPRSLSVQLGLFAGQLYISSYDDYLEICKFLGLCAVDLTRSMEKQGWRVAEDGFILGDGRRRVGGSSGLTKSPMTFFKLLMSKIRRNGDGISKTDMGQLLEGRVFYESDWEDRT